MSDRQPLTRDRIARGALAFIDEHGVPALSMRKLGASLGVEAMSLYNHVANKDDLLDSIGDLLYREVLTRYRPSDGEAASWQDDARQLALVYRGVAHEHPRALDLLTDRMVPSPVKFDFLQACYSVFTRAGFGVKDAALAFDTTASWVVGALRQELGLMAALAAKDDDRAGVPVAMQPVVDFAEACLAWTPDQRFEFGMATLIAGLERQLGRG